MIAFLLFHALPGERSKGPCDYRQLCDRFRASLAIPGENYSKLPKGSSKANGHKEFGLVSSCQPLTPKYQYLYSPYS